MMSELAYSYEPVFEAKRKKWNEQRLKEQREIAKILGLPEPQAVLTPRESERVFGSRQRSNRQVTSAQAIQAGGQSVRTTRFRSHRQQQAMLSIFRSHRG
jgi:hypothetical protein